MCKHWCLYGVPSICAQSCAPDSFARVLGEPWACQCPVLPSLLSARLLLLKLPFSLSTLNSSRWLLRVRGQVPRDPN